MCIYFSTTSSYVWKTNLSIKPPFFGRTHCAHPMCYEEPLHLIIIISRSERTLNEFIVLYGASISTNRNQMYTTAHTPGLLVFCSMGMGFFCWQRYEELNGEWELRVMSFHRSHSLVATACSALIIMEQKKRGQCVCMREKERGSGTTKAKGNAE